MKGEWRRFRPFDAMIFCCGLALIVVASGSRYTSESARSTWLGIRPFAADMIRIHAVTVAGLSGEAVSGGGVDPTRGAIADRLELALRLVPDRTDVIWDDAILLSTIGDAHGARKYLRSAREYYSDPGEIDLFEAAWITWLDERDTAGAARILAESWNRGALSRAGRRMAISLAKSSGDHERARNMQMRFDAEE